MDVCAALSGIRKDLSEKGFIDKDLLVWGWKKAPGIDPAERELFFFGIKDKRFMILPFVTPENILFDRVRYYAKGEIEIMMTKITIGLAISFPNGGSAKYNLRGNGLRDMEKILSIFDP
ncbi:MAG: hypothetical protein LBE47_00200 [Methanomassiliicoccaceae archaeon]|nr:hypothetical protein [Methanomassiliicoccaceae archaeon]